MSGCAILLIAICFTCIKNISKNTDNANASAAVLNTSAIATEQNDTLSPETFSISSSTSNTTASYSESDYSGDVNIDPESTTEFPKSVDLELSIMSQYPDIPAGCESVSLTMLLNYYGYDLDKYEIIDNYLIYSDNYVIGYYGNPYASTGGGCYAPGMTDTANSFLSAHGSEYTAVNISGTDFNDLLDYIADGTPVLVWTTIGLGNCSKDYDEVYYNDTVYSWDFMEHCVVLTGYDLTNNTVTVYDPIDGIVTRDKDTFEEIYNEMYKMCIVLE